MMGFAPLPYAPNVMGEPLLPLDGAVSEFPYQTSPRAIPFYSTAEMSGTEIRLRLHRVAAAALPLRLARMAAEQIPLSRARLCSTLPATFSRQTRRPRSSDV